MSLENVALAVTQRDLHFNTLEEIEIEWVEIAAGEKLCCTLDLKKIKKDSCNLLTYQSSTFS